MSHRLSYTWCPFDDICIMRWAPKRVVGSFAVFGANQMKLNLAANQNTMVTDETRRPCDNAADGQQNSQCCKNINNGEKKSDQTYPNRPAAATGISMWWNSFVGLPHILAIVAWNCAAVAWNRNTPWAPHRQNADRTESDFWSVAHAYDSARIDLCRTNYTANILRDSDCCRTAAMALWTKGKCGWDFVCVYKERWFEFTIGSAVAFKKTELHSKPAVTWPTYKYNNSTIKQSAPRASQRHVREKFHSGRDKENRISGANCASYKTK